MNLIAAIALPIIPKMARIARSSTLSIAAMPYIDAARAAGFSHTRIILRHIMPNIIAPYLIMVTAFIAQAILLEASLSFLGLGVTEPTPAWGLMLSGASADFYKDAPWMILFPGLAITLAVFAFNMFGDSLRDWLDPKMKDVTPPMRIPSKLWVQAYVRRMAGAGAFATVVKHGDDDFGSIWIKLNRLDGTATLYGPAPEPLSLDARAARTPLSAAAPDLITSRQRRRGPTGPAETLRFGPVDRRSGGPAGRHGLDDCLIGAD